MDQPQFNVDRTAYEIIISGGLDNRWSDWFDGFNLIPLDGKKTRLVGTVADQAALHGVLTTLRDSGLTLISLHMIEEGTIPPAGGHNHVP